MPAQKTEHFDHRYPGVLISFEGIDGAGKTTLINGVERFLASHYDILKTRQPGGTHIGRQLTRMLLEDEKKNHHNPVAEFLLFAADRAEHLTSVILPALQDGQVVLCDRMSDSSYAYQGYGRQISCEHIEEVNNWAMQGITPNLTFYLKLDFATAEKRFLARSGHRSVMEQLGKEFWQRVITGFDTLAKRFPDRIITLDARQSPQEILKQATTLLEQRLVLQQKLSFGA